MLSVYTVHNMNNNNSQAMLVQLLAEVPAESVRASLQDGGSCCKPTACHTASRVGSPVQHSWSEPAIVSPDDQSLRQSVSSCTGVKLHRVLEAASSWKLVAWQ